MQSSFPTFQIESRGLLKVSIGLYMDVQELPFVPCNKPLIADAAHTLGDTAQGYLCMEDESACQGMSSRAPGLKAAVVLQLHL